jgi:hypothetical protein
MDASIRPFPRTAEHIGCIAAANAYAPELMADYNRRFAREPMNAHNAHRPLQPGEDLAQIFTWQEERTVTRNLVVHFRRLTFLIVPSADTLGLAGRRVRLHESADGQVEIRYEGQLLPYTIFDKQPVVAPGEIVENKRLGATLSVISAGQMERDQLRLSSKKLTLRQKERLWATRAQVSEIPRVPLVPTPPASNPDRLAETLAATQRNAKCGAAMATFLANFTAEQKARRKKDNDASNQRKRDRAVLALKTQAESSRVGEELQPGVDGSASLRAVRAR